jgi:hypothetical protein
MLKELNYYTNSYIALTPIYTHIKYFFGSYAITQCLVQKKASN